MPPVPPPPEEPAVIWDDPVCVSCGGRLQPSELATALHRAEAGDAEAAFLLSFHYMALEQRERQHTWARRAAELGHPVAQYNEWFSRRDSPDCATLREGLAWLERSAAVDHAIARDKLDAARRAVADCTP